MKAISFDELLLLLVGLCNHAFFLSNTLASSNIEENNEGNPKAKQDD